MDFLFVYPGYGVLGGIETLLARMSRWLTEQGHQVTVLTEFPHNLAELLPEGAQCVALGDRFREMYYYLEAGRIRRSFELGSPDVIVSFDLKSSWIACQLANMVGTHCKVIAGVFNPHVFKEEYAQDTLAFWKVETLHLKNFLKHVPPSARVFCWPEDLSEFADVHQQSGLVWPLPIDVARFVPSARDPVWGKFVSVGRLSVMKEYNLYMIDIVDELRKRGHDVTWVVYGTGRYEAEMRQRIAQKGLEKVIQLKGQIPYEEFWQAISDAYAFVGMGTAILEASFVGVPNVVATPFDREGVTNGPLYRYPKSSTWPATVPEPKLLVADELERLLKLTSAEYQAEQNAVREHVRDHDIDVAMRRFLSIVQEAEFFERRPSLYFKNYPLYLVRHCKLGLDAAVAKFRPKDSGKRFPLSHIPESEGRAQ